MKLRLVIFVLSLIVVVIIITGVAIGQDGQSPEPTSPEIVTVSTSFTYQGQLKDDGSLVNGTCDFQFELYNAVTGGSKIGSTITKTNVDVTDGRFTVTLDFGGSAFTGGNRWLLIKVRCPAGSGTYTTLAPRQQLTAVPYAEYANHAPWSGITSIPPGFADGVDDVPEASFAGGEQSVSLTATDATVRSVSITVPSAGKVIVNASGTFRFTGTGHDRAGCSITTGTVVDLSHWIGSQDFVSTTTINIYSPFGSTRGYNVSAGLHTFRLVCESFGGTVAVEDTNLNAIFIPNSGAQSLSVFESQVPPSDTESLPSECSEIADGCQP